MDAQELRNLQESYIKVYDELDEGDEELNRFQKKDERNRKYAATKGYGIPNRTTDKSRLRAHDARRGVKLKKPKKVEEQTDLYDIILSHLLDEGYAETLEAAEVIMVNMSEEWRDSILG